MTFDEIGIEEVYNHENLEDVVEMRPTADDCYVGPDLRDNEDRSLVGLADWQSDFPADSVAPKQPMTLDTVPTKDGFSIDFGRMTVEEMLSVFF